MASFKEIIRFISVNKADPSQIKLLILFKVKTINHQYRTISLMQTLNFDEFDKIPQLFIEYWSLRSEEYFLAQFSDIIYTYKLINQSNVDEAGSIPNLKTKFIKPDNLNLDRIDTLKFGGYNLPNTMDLTLWGEYHFLDDNNVIVYKKSSQLEYHIELFDNYQEVEVMLDDKTILSFTDTMLDKNDLTCFIRKSKTHEYVFQEGNLILKKILKKVQFLKSTRKSNFLSKNFITMDLETRTINEEMTLMIRSPFDLCLRTRPCFLSLTIVDRASNKNVTFC